MISAKKWRAELEHRMDDVEVQRLRLNTHTARPHSSLGNLTPEKFIRQEMENFSTGMPVETESINAGYSNM